MASIRTTFRRTAALAALMLSMLAAPVGHAAITSGTSQLVTWTCTGMDCPWGSSLSGPALVWPETAPATSARFGYTTSQPVYLPGPAANGAIIWIDSGSAAVFAGTPNGSSHRLLATLNVGDFYEVSGLAANEVLSVQGEAAFSYQIDLPPLPGDPDDPEDPPPSDQVSKLVTWSCTGSPCPWGSSLTGHALAWPAEANPINMRFGYTTSDGIYLPASRANGAVIWIDEGSATVFAGAPGASSHRVLATIDVGEFYEVSGLEPNEVLSVQSDYPFTYQFDLPPPPEPGEEPQAPPVGTPSELVTWMCHSSSCPWGTSLTGHALVWPSDAQASNLRLTYTASRPIYLDANRANGTKIAVISGSAALFAGLPGAESHRLIATLSAGEEYEVAGIGHGEVLSVQSEEQFVYDMELAPYTEVPDDGVIMHAELARWVCNLPDCESPDWHGAVINWPSWAAYTDNNRSGEQSRSVFSAVTGQPLYPYMGSWAHGCEVTVKSGTVLIIEWERGTDVWRETWLSPGDTHVIQLTSPENGAMIEAEDYSPGFTVSLKNCTPQPLP